MKILTPTTLTDSILISTNVTESDPGIYVAGTTYSTGDNVSIENGLYLDIYESLQDSNTGNNPETEDEWWVFRSSIYPEYSISETYSEGDHITVESSHLVYESLQGSNTGKTPGIDTDWWLEISATNTWAAFDQKVGNQTVRTGSITFELLPNLVEGIAFFNLDASNIDITLTYDGEIVFSDNVELVSSENVFDMYSYAFSDFITKQNYVETALPPYRGAILSISINGGGDTTTVKCGEIAFGEIKDTGTTLYSPSFEIRDYSTKTQDDYGNFEIVERAFSKIVTVDVRILTASIGYVQDIFETYRATPLVWIPTEVDGMLSPYLTYGFYNRFSIVTNYLNRSIASIEIIGLT